MSKRTSIRLVAHASGGKNLKSTRGAGLRPGESPSLRSADVAEAGDLRPGSVHAGGRTDAHGGRIQK